MVATHNVPTNEAEAKFWQDSLLRQSSKVPFPVAYESNEDMTWFKNQFGRICVKFNGLSEHSFQVYCDSRHLHWFQRFLEDQQIKKNSKNQHSSSLFTLRSGRLAWQEEEGKGDPWNVNRVTLYCSVDTRLWTIEGTNQVREKKAEKIAKIITNTKAKGKLNEEQQAHVKRQNSTLDTINNPFPRPTKPLYKGQSHILVGISLGLEKPATLAVVDGTTGQVITYHSIRQLLGDNYKLLNRQRQQKHFLSHQRQIAQTLAPPNQFGESELGEYIDRLLAKEIIAIAQTYSAGSIVLPKLDNMREQVQSEVQAKAEQKSDLIEVQKKYAKQYRVSVHQWSYSRLMANIHSSAVQAGIVIEESEHPIRGSPQEKAKELAIAAYHSRKIN
ncbi:MAG: type V CRISPR-associated protein Cas12k [Nostoc sp.]